MFFGVARFETVEAQPWGQPWARPSPGPGQQDIPSGKVSERLRSLNEIDAMTFFISFSFSVGGSQASSPSFRAFPQREIVSGKPSERKRGPNEINAMTLFMSFSFTVGESQASSPSFSAARIITLSGEIARIQTLDQP